MNPLQINIKMSYKKVDRKIIKQIIKTREKDVDNTNKC